ncbi:MAG: tetratricopeptide repeat protein [Spirochaetaceae bacterium]|jgi:tetratricopeptide (TPR) repeat protein|nr:tetratricopeptide repeat protein [Spirochaetaceae bacterium]
MKNDGGSFMPRLLVYYCVFLLLLSCSNNAQVREVPINRPRPSVKPEQPFQQIRPAENSNSVAADIRALCDEGSPSALFKVLSLLHENNIEESEFGRMMSAVAITLLIKVYDEPRDSLPGADPPKNHAYSRILAEAGRGIYREPPPSSNDYLEHILPFLALLDDTAQSRFAAALPDLEKARQLNEGALAPYFMGLAMERMDRSDEAPDLYAEALALAPDCYPAVFGIVRVLQEHGRDDEAVRMLAALNNRYPDNIIIMRHLAGAYFRQSDWISARRMIDAALEIKPQDPDLSLMLARVLFEDGQFVQMQAILDRYSAENPENNRNYTLLRARLQGEGFKNRENAINILRPLYKLNPDDFSVALYLTKLLLESNNDEEQAEGGRLLKNLTRPPRNGEEIPLDVIILASEDAVRRASWDEAMVYQDRILSERRIPSTLVNAFKVERGAGNRRSALALAEELIQNYPDYEEGRLAYTEALIDSGRHGEAQRLIDARIAALSSSVYKSRYYYLRGLLRGSFDSAVSDFRSSLFENPRNLDALKALVDIYAKRGDERHVVYYLRQAMALSPKDPVLLEYQKEYSGKM